MSSALDQIVDAVLYEGFILYPYRPSAKKNRQRFTCGRVYPQAYSLSEKGLERCAMQTECLVLHSEQGELEVELRFLHPLARDVAVPTTTRAETQGQGEDVSGLQVVPEVEVDGQLYQTWQEATERRVQSPTLSLNPTTDTASVRFSFGASETLTPVKNAAGSVAAVLVRRQEGIEGTIEVSVRQVGENVGKVTVRVLNQTPVSAAELLQPEAVLLRTMASTHLVLRLRNAEFSSLLESLPEHKKLAGECVNLGTWPVLVGDRQKAQRDTMLSSPIILYDYPQVAPESPGASFDGTEIDELLALCIQTLTEDEKREMRTASEHTRRLLERTEALSQQDWLRLHGARREPLAAEPNPEAAKSLTEVTIAGVSVRVGDPVRLKPQGRADIFDLALQGQLAQVEAIEEDFEGRVHVAVVLEKDPGKDLGLLRQPGHRFFFGIDELEPVGPSRALTPSNPEVSHE